MWAAPKLLGAPTIGGGSARSGDGGGGGHRSQISLPSRPKYTKKAKHRQFRARFGLRIAFLAIFKSISAGNQSFLGVLRAGFRWVKHNFLDNFFYFC